MDGTHGGKRLVSGYKYPDTEVAREERKEDRTVSWREKRFWIECGLIAVLVIIGFSKMTSAVLDYSARGGIAKLESDIEMTRQEQWTLARQQSDMSEREKYLKIQVEMIEKYLISIGYVKDKLGAWQLPQD